MKRLRLVCLLVLIAHAGHCTALAGCKTENDMKQSETARNLLLTGGP